MGASNALIDMIVSNINVILMLMIMVMAIEANAVYALYYSMCRCAFATNVMIKAEYLV